jgi:SAM-dependent methyltransferase
MRLALSLTMRLLAVALSMAALLTLCFFPRTSDAPLTATQKAELQRYYDTEFPEQGDPSSAEESWHKIVTGRVGQFAREYSLGTKKVLDVGSGRGYLQDVVNDYTGLDISPSAKRLYHKPFIVGSATFMPFSDSRFDSAWTLFVLEHVDNPEAALVEIRRVVKDGGVLFLAPAWDVSGPALLGFWVRRKADQGFASVSFLLLDALEAARAAHSLSHLENYGKSDSPLLSPRDCQLQALLDGR